MGTQRIMVILVLYCLLTLSGCVSAKIQAQDFVFPPTHTRHGTAPPAHPVPPVQGPWFGNNQQVHLASTLLAF
jgi:hypothetical protein